MNRHSPWLAGLTLALLAALPSSTTATQAAAAVAAVPDGADLHWSLQLPPREDVLYRGLANFDQAGVEQNGFLYPAPNVPVALVAMLTRGSLLSSSKEKQKREIQAEANKVLEPFASLLSEFHASDLLRRSLVLSASGAGVDLVKSGDHPQSWLMLVAPVYSMTQDRSAMVLDNLVAIYAPGESKTPSYHNTIRVVGETKTAPELTQFWSDQQGEALREESAQLLAISLDVALADATGKSEGSAFKTIRYVEGSEQHFERGRPLTEQCGRMLLPTLRGSLMSVMLKPDIDATPVHCESRTRDESRSG